MNDEGRPAGGPRNDHPLWTVAPPGDGAGPAPARATGLQVCIGIFVAQLEAARDQLDSRSYAVMLDVVGRHLDAERKRCEFSIRRWAA